jgi:hypothetical protein
MVMAAPVVLLPHAITTSGMSQGDLEVTLWILIAGLVLMLAALGAAAWNMFKK